jgi:tetratricopeptide (TPR) repeat protein
MNKWTSWIVVSMALALPLLAQGHEPGRKGAADASAGKAADKPADKARAKVAQSDEGRAALAGAKDLAARARGLEGAERARALELAATAYDKVATDFAAEPAVGGYAAITAADLWRQHGTLPAAEKAYQLAAGLDGARYGQRALLGAADMQRRQQRADDAMATYARVVALEPSSSRAQHARLWQGRLLQGGERLDEAVVAFQAALESADPGAETIEACNFLALCWIDKNDLDAAARVLAHADQHVANSTEEDPLVVERLKRQLDGMSARKALQRTRDRQNEVGKDAAALEAERSKQGAK